MKIPKKLLKQYNIPWIGGAKILLVQVVFYGSCINFLLIAVTAYHTTLRGYFVNTLTWMTFPIFFISLLIILTIAMVLEYKFVLSSLYLFTSKQMTLVDRLDKISVKLDKLLEKDNR